VVYLLLNFIILAATIECCPLLSRSPFHSLCFRVHIVPIGRILQTLAFCRQPLQMLLNGGVHIQCCPLVICHIQCCPLVICFISLCSWSLIVCVYWLSQLCWRYSPTWLVDWRASRSCDWTATTCNICPLWVLQSPSLIVWSNTIAYQTFWWALNGLGMLSVHNVWLVLSFP